MVLQKIATKSKQLRQDCARQFIWILICAFALVPQVRASFSGNYDLSNFTITNSDADGMVSLGADGSLQITGGNTGSGLAGNTDVTIAAVEAGSVSFDYAYASLDFPGFDVAGYLIGAAFMQLADSDGLAGSVVFQVAKGELFGFRVRTSDNTGEPGVLTISDFEAPGASGAIPEPGSFGLILIGSAAVAAFAARRRGQMNRFLGFCVGFLATLPLVAQSQPTYTGANVTGQFVLTRTVNALEASRQGQFFGFARRRALPETLPKILPKRLHPPLVSPPSSKSRSAASLVAAVTPSLVVTPGSSGFGFLGLTHLDQRNANNGNQFSTEPPNPSIAVANGFVLEGVNNAIQVYNSTGGPLLDKVLSTNELFGVPAAIDRITGANGVFPTDMRVFHDQTLNRWFVLQRAQDFDIDGFPLNSSRIYVAVSQTANPTGTYNIYTMDTTDPQNPGCPCVADYPQIGADQYGFYISSNEFHAASLSFVNAQILALSKASLAAGAATPTAYRFRLPFTTGYEFAIQPATTPPGASYMVASGGVEYFMSTHGSLSFSSNMAIWAMYNTSSLNTANPALTLTQKVIPTLTHIYPDVATQRPGPRPYGSSLTPPGPLSYIDGGDTRILSVSYAGGRLYATLGTQVTDETGQSVVGGAFLVLSPTLRAGVLAGPVLRQGYLSVRGNHLLRPAIAVNPQGRGAIAMTLVGPDYYPSAAFVPINTLSTGTALQVPGPGTSPQDGFTGYVDGFGVGVARWGDYSAAVATGDGAIWMTAEYIPSAPRSEFANWGTYVVRYVP